MFTSWTVWLTLSYNVSWIPMSRFYTAYIPLAKRYFLHSFVLFNTTLLKLNTSVFCNTEVILIGNVHKLNSMVYFMFYDLALNICSEQTHVWLTWLGITHYWHMYINYTSLTSDARLNLVGCLTARQHRKVNLCQLMQGEKMAIFFL